MGAKNKITYFVLILMAFCCGEAMLRIYMDAMQNIKPSIVYFVAFFVYLPYI